MSRIGRKPIVIPQGVKVDIKATKVHVEGPKGKLDLEVHPRMQLSMANGQVEVKRPTENQLDKSLHGLTRTLVDNMVKGVTQGFSKTLEIEGVGFKAVLQGKTLQLSLGFSHPIAFPIPEGIKVEAPKPTIVTVSGPDKVMVGQVAANIRAFFPPEPYKGKGVRYTGEKVRRKQGKQAG